MEWVYVPALEGASVGKQVPLPPDEARHALKALRLRPGDILKAMDGHGLVAEGKLLQPAKDVAVLHIASISSQPLPFLGPLLLCVAPPKHPDRLEWMVEKCTELGAAQIVWLQTEHAERARLTPERLQRIAVAASKQCGRAVLPLMPGPMPLAQAIEMCVDAGVPMLGAHCMAGPKALLADALAGIRDGQGGSGAALFIGPEGDFSPAEVAQLMQADATAVTLGPLRLRTETAAVAGMAHMAFALARPGAGLFD